MRPIVKAGLNGRNPDYETGELMEIRYFAALLLCLCVGLSIKSAESAEQASLDAAVHAYEEFYGITGGAVAVLRDDQVIYRKTFGQANVELSVPVRQIPGFNYLRRQNYLPAR